MKALVTGGTGLLGQELLAGLPEAVVLSRDPARASGRLGRAAAFRWDPEVEPAPPQAFLGVDAVFNLAGEAVAKGRWTEEKKRRIRDSRILGTRNLVAGLKALDARPEVLVSASAVGYYGDRGDELLDERAPEGRGFLAEVCADWEKEARAAEDLGIRVVCVRIGIVLSADGGAIERMLTPFKMGAGGRLGSGKQWMPWIHIEDVVGILLHASRSQEIRGSMNAVSPNPVTNAEFTRALGGALHRPAFLPIPKTALRLAFGEMSEVLMDSQRALPGVATHTGYSFKHPELSGALATILSPPHRKAL